MKNYNFKAIFQNFNENFAIFTKFFKNFSNFSRKFGEKLELCSCRGVPVGRAPRTQEKFSNFFLLKSNEKLQCYANYNLKMPRIFGENLGKI